MIQTRTVRVRLSKTGTEQVTYKQQNDQVPVIGGLYIRRWAVVRKDGTFPEELSVEVSFDDGEKG